MFPEPIYGIILFPTRELVRRDCTLREAAAWLATYNAIMDGGGRTAAIVEGEPRDRRSKATGTQRVPVRVLGR